jgi:hypothetical protein
VHEQAKLGGGRGAIGGGAVAAVDDVDGDAVGAHLDVDDAALLYLV